MNERITESITRKLLREKGYTKEHGFKVEEQKTKNKEIDSLLTRASKSGKGKGYPEFIVTTDNDKDFVIVIVIECKADVCKHTSKELNKANDFAVDGAIHYGKFIADKKNVVAIGISGQTEEELLIDIHFITKKTKMIFPIENKNTLLDYKLLTGETPIARQNLKEKEDELLKYSEELHIMMNKEAKLSEEDGVENLIDKRK